jgi:hypothetical protein
MIGLITCSAAPPGSFASKEKLAHSLSPLSSGTSLGLLQPRVEVSPRAITSQVFTNTSGKE